MTIPEMKELGSIKSRAAGITFVPEGPGVKPFLVRADGRKKMTKKARLRLRKQASEESN